MDIKHKTKPSPGFALILGLLMFAVLLGLTGEMHPATAMKLTAGAPPNAKPDTYKYVSGNQLDVVAPGVLANDTDPDAGDTVTAVPDSGNTVQNGTYSLLADGSFSYTPPTGYNGDDSFTYFAIDSSTPQLQSLATKVTLLTNYPPTAWKDTFYYTTTTGVIVPTLPTGGVLANDTDPEDATTALKVYSSTATFPVNGSTTMGGTYSLDENGIFTYTPPTTTPAFTGEDSFTYRTVDTGGKISGYAIVTLRNSLTYRKPPPTGMGTGTCMFADCAITNPTGNYCTANDLIIRSIYVLDVVDLCGPPICNPVTNVCQPDTGIYDFAVEMDPNATTLYGIGLWVETENLPGQPIVYSGAMQGTNCYKGYLFPNIPPEPTTHFNAFGGPYWDDNTDTCGDARDESGYTTGIFYDVPVVCTDELMEGLIATVATWAPSSQKCTGPDGTCAKTSSKCFADVVPFDVSNKPVDLMLTKTSSITDGYIPYDDPLDPTDPTAPFQFEYTVKIENDPDNRGCYRSSGYVIEDLLPAYLKAVDADPDTTAVFDYISAKSYIISPTSSSSDLDDGDSTNGPEVVLGCVDQYGDSISCDAGSILQIKVQNNLPITGTIPIESIQTLLDQSYCDNQYHEITFLVEYVPGEYAPRRIENNACVNGFQYDPWGGAQQYVDPTSGEIVVIDASGNNCDDDVVITEVDLAYFTAAGQQKDVLLEWETTSERDNLGFNIYRAESENGPRIQLNAEMIWSTSPGSMLGSTYSYVDDFDLKGLTTYYYWLEDVDIYGVKTLHGPVSAKPSFFTTLYNFFMFLPSIFGGN